MSSFSLTCTGVLAVCAVLYDKLGKQDKSERCITKLQSLCDRVCHDKSLPDEVLYGRAGYLFSLLFIQQNLGQDKIDTNIIDQVCHHFFECVMGQGSVL